MSETKVGESSVGPSPLLSIPAFHVQPLLSELYQSRDLLDLSAPEAGPSSPPSSLASPSAPSLFASATSIAAAAGRRAAAAAGASPILGSATGTVSPERQVAAPKEEAGKQEVRCVEGYGQNLYIGRSDGVVEWWVCDGGKGASTSKGEGWSLRHKHTLFPRRAVSKIVLIPKAGKVLVLSEGTLHALSLPNLEPVPSTQVPPMRGVISIILDDDEMDWAGPGTEDRNVEVTVVLVRRRGLAMYGLGTRMQAVKEIPLPSAPTSHALTRTYLCAAIPSTNLYSLIDISDASLTEVLPVSQIDADTLDFVPNPNVVVIPGEDEFLVTSFTGAGTMGVFLNGQGDPVRGTMEWEHHPLSITVEAGYIIALLRNGSITVHALSDLERAPQVITLDSTLQPVSLSYSPYGVSVKDAARDDRMQITNFRLLGGKLAPEGSPSSSLPPARALETEIDAIPASIDQSSSVEPIDISSPTTGVIITEEPPSGSGLTPPSSPPSFKRQPITPVRQSSLLQAIAPTSTSKSSGGPFSTCVAETLVIGPNGVMSLAPLSPVLKLEEMCKRGLNDEAIALVDDERRRGRRGEVDSDKATHQATLRLLHLYLACHLFKSGMFERAGDYLVRGKIDARLIVRLFPKLRGKMIGSEEEVDVFEGLKGVLGDMGDVDEIVAVAAKAGSDSNDAEGSSAKDEKSGALLEGAKAMLTEFLKKTRQSRRKGGGSRGMDSRKLDMVIDTTLAKLLSEAGIISELLELLAAPNDCVLSEIEPFLTSRPYVLSKVMRRHGKHARVLELLQQVAEDSPDPLCPDPIDEIASELQHVKDPGLLRKYALWLVERDIDRGLSILFAQNTKSGVKLDDPELVDDLRKINNDAANRYLEYVVLSKKSPNRAFHEDLLGRLLDAVSEQVKDDGVKYHLEELDAEYRLLPDPEPFCTFIADVAPDTPIKSLRLKLMLFLQGSPFYDLHGAADRLESVFALKYEYAIVLGRLGRTTPALRILARDVGDSVSAQTYCTQGGEIIPPKIARKVAQRVPELAAWAAMGEVGRKRRGTVDAKTQEGLVMELLGVYMKDGAKTSKEAAALLNAQSLHLDPLEITSMLPPEWPLDVVSSFIQRALRRQLHEQHTWQILKAISAGENMEISEEYLEAIRRIPPVVQPRSSSPTPPPLGSGGSEGKESVVVSEKSEGYSLLDEGSRTEKEPVLGEKQRAREYFSPEVIDKELKELGLMSEEGQRMGPL